MNPQSEVNDEFVALGRYRAGHSTKIHVRSDGEGTLLGITATGGQHHESTELENLIASRELGRHRYDSRPEVIAGDKGYSSNAIRQFIRDRQIKPVIGSKAHESRGCEF
ncbi:Transposase DDE domain protein [Rosistilla carotiformis]|uniref:Transposase DDE domain protein n=1 Tax=Rosistilla carotiformis TaxID=2528017 RepID=A0A518JV18_9BACT|nr:Transposase DDE domain protein [Rosistilla carotiformis]